MRVKDFSIEGTNKELTGELKLEKTEEINKKASPPMEPPKRDDSAEPEKEEIGKKTMKDISNLRKEMLELSTVLKVLS